MKKICLFSVAVLILTFFLSADCFAEIDKEEKDEFSLINGEKLYEIIDDDTRKFFIGNGIDISDPSWVNKITPKSVFSGLSDIFMNGFKKPMKCGISILMIIVLTAGFTSFDLKSGTYKTVVIFCTLACSLLILKDMGLCVSAAVSALKYIGTFMASFVPVFVAAVSFSGGVVSGAASGGLILLAANAVLYFANEFVLPIMGGYLSLNLVSCISPFDSLSKMTQGIKKAVIWTLSLIFSVFVGIVGIGTTVNGAADSFALKTTKFIIGTCIPIAGGPLSDSASTIYASMNILKSSVGVYGVLVVAMATVPIIMQILIWKCVLGLTADISAGFSQSFLSSFLSSLNELLSVLVAILIFSGGVFIISLGIVVSVTKI